MAFARLDRADEQDITAPPQALRRRDLDRAVDALDVRSVGYDRRCIRPDAAIGGDLHRVRPGLMTAEQREVGDRQDRIHIGRKPLDIMGWETVRHEDRQHVIDHQRVPHSVPPFQLGDGRRIGVAPA